MLGSKSAQAIEDMVGYAQETQHEKILRGLAVGIALVMYGRMEEADALIESLCRDKVQQKTVNRVHLEVRVDLLKQNKVIIIVCYRCSIYRQHIIMPIEIKVGIGILNKCILQSHCCQ